MKQINKLQYLIRNATQNVTVPLSTQQIVLLATEMSAIIDAEGMCLCWMSDFEDQLKSLEAKDAK